VPGPFDYFTWFLSAFFQALVVGCAFKGHALQRYLPLNLCMLATSILTVGRFVVFFKYGLLSVEYIYFYYYTEAVLTVCLYFALMNLYSQVFQELDVHKWVRAGAILLLGLTAAFSYQVVASSPNKMTTRFVVEIGQNMNFVGLVLTYLLWGAILKLRETRTRLIQLVLALGVYFSVFAANYALRNLYPNLTLVWHYVPPLMALWLPMAWAYTFLKIPEEARLAPARVAAPNR